MQKPKNNQHLRIVRTSPYSQQWYRVRKLVGYTLLVGGIYFGAHTLYMNQSVRGKLTELTGAGLRDALAPDSCPSYDARCMHRLFSSLSAKIQARMPKTPELVQFLKSSKTSQHPYIRPTFVCKDFAESLVLEAQSKKIPMAYVEVEFDDNPEGHAITAFPLKEDNWVYFDPTSNSKSIVKLKVGARPVYIPVINRTNFEKSYDVALSEAGRYDKVEKEFNQVAEYLKNAKEGATPPDYNQQVDRYNDLLERLEVLPRVRYDQGIVRRIDIKPLRLSQVRASTLEWVEKNITKVN